MQKQLKIENNIIRKSVPIYIIALITLLVFDIIYMKEFNFSLSLGLTAGYIINVLLFIVTVWFIDISIEMSSGKYYSAFYMIKYATYFGIFALCVYNNNVAKFINVWSMAGGLLLIKIAVYFTKEVRQNG